MKQEQMQGRNDEMEMEYAEEDAEEDEEDPMDLEDMENRGIDMDG